MQDVRKKIKALFVWMAEVKEELSKPQTPNLADCNAALYSRRKKHFIFDSINTITAPSFR